MIYLTFLSAILLSGIAAYYSVIGLAAIFAGAFWPVVFMGSSLELAKLVTASWLYRNWRTAPFLIKSYLTAAVVLLMLITSMGIFGFLAKSHIDSTLDAGANTVEIKTLNTQEKIAKDRLDYLLARAKDPATASNKLDRQIQDTQKEISEINKKKLPLLREENKLVADVGPIKYVADMFFEGDGAIDKAVRMVIFLIMLVFDPLAVLLLIAANISLKQRETEAEPVENTPIIKGDEIVGFASANTNLDIPVFVPEKKEDKIEIEKENLATIEAVEPIKIPEPVDPFTGEIQKPRVEHHAPGVYSEHHTYDYDNEYAFAPKKSKLDGGDF